MTRKLAAAVLSVWAVVVGTFEVSAAEKTIEAKTTDAGEQVWQPKETIASVGDEVQWKLGIGTHGVRITNWAAVKDHVEVMTVTGQQPFNATTGRNDASTSTAGKVLLRLKVKSVPPAKLEFNCIVHGATMNGTVSASAAEKTIEAKTTDAGEQVWQPKETIASVGDEVQWKLGIGTHGVRITNWAAVKDHVEVMTVTGQQPFNATTGRNDASTSTAGKVLLRLKVKSVPPAKLEFNCIVHGATMNGTVSASAAEKTIEAKTTDAGEQVWQPKETIASVGDEVQWKLGIGTHGVRITNWAAVKDHVEVMTVTGQQPFNATTGRNDASTSAAGKVLLRLKVKSVPPAKLEFNCIVHGATMNGTVSASAAEKTGKVKTADRRAGDLPNVILKTENNKGVRFYDDLIKDKIVILNFMYTRCDGKLCGQGTKNLLEVQKALGDRLGREVFIYSITLDPEHDTPAVLKEYAETYGAKWSFLTGKAEDIATLRRKLGLSGLDPDLRLKLGLPKRLAATDADRKQHSGMIVIGYDALNKWSKTSILSRPDQILQIIERMKPPPSVHGAVDVTSQVSAAGKIIEAKPANLQKVQEFFDKFGKGDVPGVLNTMSDDVDWFIPGPSTIPYSGQRKGREQVGKFFGAFSDAVEVQSFEPREFITQKDKVVVLGHEVLKVKTTANVVKNEWVMVFTIDKERITRFRSYEDTAALVTAFGRWQ